MYHNLPLRTGLVFSFAEGNGVTWIRDYSRLLKLAFSRKDFVKMIGKGRGGEGRGSENYPLLFHRQPFHLRKYFFVKGKGIEGI